MSDNRMRPLRSRLFTPATPPERYAKTTATSADALILDLEDTVAPGDKDPAGATAPGRRSRGLMLSSYRHERLQPPRIVMNIASLYQSKLTTLAQAVAGIASGSRISMAMAQTEPPALPP